MATVLIPLAQGCEELEAVTLIDLLRRAGVTVVVAGLEQGAVTASRGVVLLPEVTLDAVLDRDFDLVVLPGGLGGAQRLEADQRIATLLRRQAEQGRYIGAICAAPKVLASAGLLNYREATAYPGILDGQSEIRLSSAAVVRDGTFLTSRGPGTAMDFALVLIELLCGRGTRDEVEAALQRS
ncbi:MAG: DJ-1/PfpI family protein [Candidatus Competibacteraceae bacterium]|jgi:4-methyl-5(b-hydroxyethyl)-thiazole monophosphate biosynthesis|nr:DJ-1/PfpI family protein [Candidatus Competibacteraceae bacterium]MBK7983934.1 DJ-1/PfpI family protein [Candidatus Competibacteraceae bacterium]MBK8897524.1 DJ-1/PfpI family protein [Candidatus Competibacteraceae bacterium]MBK8963676.1 DJ-1/PfpI family protein [Candidatus Competibacteraceae bacterium]MBK9950566.1 DJ-1/PfpI family protein [Candidatus Competibacteraceae bacterium]